MNLADRSKSTLALILGCVAITVLTPSCGDSDSVDTPTAGTGGKAGSSSGGKGGTASAGKGGTASAGKGGSGTAGTVEEGGAGGSDTGGGGSSAAGSGGSSAGTGGSAAGSGGATAGSGGKGGSGGTGTGGSSAGSGGKGGSGGSAAGSGGASAGAGGSAAGTGGASAGAGGSAAGAGGSAAGAGGASAGAGGSAAGAGGSTAGTGGSAAGSGGSGGSGNTPTIIASFNTTTESWGPKNGVVATVAFDGSVDSEGSASSGSLLVNVPFVATDTQSDIGLDYQANPVNLAGKTLSIRVRLDSGPATTAVKILVKGMNYAYGQGPDVPLTVGQWTTISLPSTALNFDAATVWELDLAVRDDNATCTGGCPAVLHIDTVTASPTN